MSGLPGITDIRSVSRFGLSAVYIYFEENLDLYFVRRLVLERLPDARAAIPAGLGTPIDGPHQQRAGRDLSVRGAWRRAVADGPALASSNGTSPSSSGRCPASSRSTRTAANSRPTRCRSTRTSSSRYNISLETVFEALEGNNANAGGAYIERAQEQYVIRGEGLVEKIADIDNIVVAGQGRHTGLHQEPGHDRAGAPGASGRRHPRRPRRSRDRRRDDADGRELPRGRGSREDRTGGDQEQPAARASPSTATTTAPISCARPSAPSRRT